MSHIQPNTHLPLPVAIKVYTAILNQTGTDNPVASIKHNTTGATITWTRTGAGTFLATINTNYNVAALFATQNLTGRLLFFAQTGTTTAELKQTSLSSVLTDGMTNVTVEIRIY